MRLRQYFLAATLAGCSFEHSLAPDSVDANTATDTGEACKSFSSQVDTCVLAPAEEGLTLAGQYTYDTTQGKLRTGTTEIPITRMQVMGKAGPIELVLVSDFHMMPNASLRATGDFPLAVLAFNMIAIDGNATIDVSAGGAGARAACDGGAINGMPDAGGGGGGGGGGFAALGGSGGNGDKDGPPPTPGGPGGAAQTTTPQGPLGGCPGARGGDGDDSGGNGGAGGGAIYLVAAHRIDLAPGSGINAGGAGGRGGNKTGLNNGDAGGGGGGSGGMIMIESPLVRSAGALAANGGGGGEASGGGGNGNPGNAGALALTGAPGGSGSSDTGTDGASGGAQASTSGASVTAFDNGGGGGGGGSVGYIFIKSIDAVISVVSPSPL